MSSAVTSGSPPRLAARLDNIPFDILYLMIPMLTLEDLISLSITCRYTKIIIEEHSFCRKIVEMYIPYSMEGILARRQEISYSQALKDVQDRRDAISKVYPFSARNFGQGTSFTYRQGVLCVLNGTHLYVSYLGFPNRNLDLDLCSLLSSAHSYFDDLQDLKISLLHYSDNVVSLYTVNRLHRNSSLLFAISTREKPLEGTRIMARIVLESSYKLFVRNSETHLSYGTFTGIGNTGHHEWRVGSLPLSHSSSASCHPRWLQLESFTCDMIGVTCAFEIHDGHFYAIAAPHDQDEDVFLFPPSNKERYENNFRNYYYHCLRFPVALPYFHAAQEKNIFRRQDREGPIHDSWTNISLQIDEGTNALMIVESRREWRQACSHANRTAYFTTIDFHHRQDNSLSDRKIWQDGDKFSLYESPLPAPSPRRPQNFHRESLSKTHNSKNFLLAHTNYSMYNYSTQSFIDLVEDHQCCEGSQDRPCLRIRISSRRPTKHAYGSSNNRLSASFGSTETEVFKYSPIRLWPPPAHMCPCSRRLHQILTPPGSLEPRYKGKLVVASDERNLVYMIRPHSSCHYDERNTLGTIVVIQFTRDSSFWQGKNTDLHTEESKLEDEDISRHWKWTPGLLRSCECYICD
ncbi:hypothetical protein B0J11DRAFT_440293 [Dendryphion nanum]|uniref:F-box domain-containing protein n=1 Tax=Dendryphion nanum TaxID=256645 RepID=A0A9P9DGA2_9PLEO|nr:hypothetical protein B0J11DRAFT_440293 [Dendryphion nanum]